MDINKLLAQAARSGESDKEIIAMILSNRCDMATEKGALLSVKKFYEVADDILLWRERAVKASTEASQQLVDLNRLIDVAQFNIPAQESPSVRWGRKRGSR